MRWICFLLPLSAACAPTDAQSEDTAGGACSDTPVVNYASFGQGFVIEQCQGCHASTAPDRYDAPADITFDTVDEVWALADRVLERAAADEPTMPPGGGTTADDRTLLRWWLTCAEEGT